MAAVPPSGTVTVGASGATEGATLRTFRPKLTETLAPLLSVPVMVTVRLSSGPSDVGDDHAQVPSAFLTTVPDDAVRVTGWMPLPPQAPVLAAVWPSETVTSAWFTVTARPDVAIVITSWAVSTPLNVAM